jgi:hypothetical protein
MLDAYSHGEWLLDDIKSLRENHLIGITSRVSDGEDEGVTLDSVPHL